MTRARNIANPTQITIPLTVSANISSNATLSIGNTTVNSIITGVSVSVGNSTVNTSINSTSLTTGSNTATIGTAAYVVANGNVGIGTASPTQKLDVDGNSAITGTGFFALQRPLIPSSADQGTPQIAFRFYSTGTTYTTGAQIYALTDAAWSSTSAPTDLLFSTVPSGSTTLVERMRIDSAGNMGIGTTSPSDTVGYGRALDIQSTIGAAVYMRDSTNPTTQYGFIAFDGNADVNNLNVGNASSAGPIRLITNGVERARIDSAGNVGIGTISPGQRLHVNGNIRVEGSTSEILMAEGAERTISVSGSSPSTVMTFKRWNGSSYTSDVTMNANGNMLVGTTSNVRNWNNSLIKMRVDNGIQFGIYSAIAEDLFDADSLGICCDSTENICFGQYNTANGTYTERARIDSSGNFKVISGQTVLVGGLAVGTSSLIGSVIYFGSSVISAGAGTYPLKWNSSTGIVTYDTSSRLVKENIEDSPYGLTEVLQLKSRKYHRTDDQRDEIGLVADEVQAVMPEFVPLVAKSIFTKDEADTELIAGGVNYDKLTSVLVKAIQEQQATIQTLTDRITALEGV